MNDMLSPSDVALITGRNNNNDGMFGDNGAWWIVLFLIFAMGGWGNGFGGFGNNGGGSVAGMYTLNSDFATLQRLMDNGFDRIADGVTQVNNGLCNGFYQELVNANTINSNIANSTASLQSTLCQGFGNLNTSIQAQGYETRLGTQSLASQLASCCCDIRQAISDCCCTTNRNIDNVNYNMAMNTNTLQNTLCNTTRDIIESQNNGTRAILDAITANRIEDKNAQIQAQQNEINALRLSASQSAQNAYLIDQLKPCPIPAYIACNPYQSINYNNGCGCNGCGNY